MDRSLVFSTLDDLHSFRGPLVCVIHGACNCNETSPQRRIGADVWADEWAEDRGVKAWKFPADWMLLGKAAGPRRNQKMLNEGKPDLVVAFPGGKGTADMVRKARVAGVEVMEPPHA